MGICITNCYLCYFDSETLVDNLLKYRPLALRANQSCELNETLHTYDTIVALLIVSLFVPLGSMMHPQCSNASGPRCPNASSMIKENTIITL